MYVVIQDYEPDQYLITNGKVLYEAIKTSRGRVILTAYWARGELTNLRKDMNLEVEAGDKLEFKSNRFILRNDTPEINFFFVCSDFYWDRIKEHLVFIEDKTKKVFVLKDAPLHWTGLFDT